MPRTKPATSAERKLGLPLAWSRRKAPNGETYTVRWGRGDGFLTIHLGDRKGHRDDVGLVEEIHVGHDWTGQNEVGEYLERWIARRCDSRR